MAVQGNGPFSIGDIWREIVYLNPFSLEGPPYAEDAPRSLSALSNPFPNYINVNNPADSRPDREVPHAMSEFRGYDQDAPAPISSIEVNLYRTISSPAEACANTPNYTAYYDGFNYDNWYEAFLYQNSDGTTLTGAVGGGYWFSDGTLVAFYNGNGSWEPAKPCTDFDGGGGGEEPPINPKVGTK